MERRAFKRAQTEVEVDARVSGRLSRVTLSDLSVNGCCLRTSNGFVEAGDTIMLIFPDQIHMVGQVVWRDGRNAGVEFRTPMHEALVSHLGFYAEPVDAQAANPCTGHEQPWSPALRSRSSTFSTTGEVAKFFR